MAIYSDKHVLQYHVLTRDLDKGLILTVVTEFELQASVLQSMACAIFSRFLATTNKTTRDFSWRHFRKSNFE